MRPYTRDEFPVCRIGAYDGRERSIATQQRSSCFHGQTWSRRDRGFRWVPKPSFNEGLVQPQDSLPLDHRSSADDVVADKQALSDDRHSKLLESLRHSKRKLVYIGGHNGHMEKCRSRSAGESDDFEKRAPTSHFAKVKWQ